MNPDQNETLTLNAAALRGEMENLSGLADRFGDRLVGSFASAVVHGRSLSETMRTMMLNFSQTALTAAMKPLGDLVGNLFGNMLGGAGPVTAFADGGIVGSPTLFAMQGGAGLMGEAGPEAIMPLARGPYGSLGVRGGGGAHVTVNISTPDAQSFSQSSGQVAAQMMRALQRAQRNM